MKKHSILLMLNILLLTPHNMKSMGYGWVNDRKMFLIVTGTVLTSVAGGILFFKFWNWWRGPEVSVKTNTSIKDSSHNVQQKREADKKDEHEPVVTQIGDDLKSAVSDPEDHVVVPIAAEPSKISQQNQNNSLASIKIPMSFATCTGIHASKVNVKIIQVNEDGEEYILITAPSNMIKRIDPLTVTHNPGNMFQLYLGVLQPEKSEVKNEFSVDYTVALKGLPNNLRLCDDSNVQFVGDIKKARPCLRYITAYKCKAFLQ